jgi:lipoprotein-releasing system permease protein
MLSIALAVVVNLITIAVVTGFQHEVRDKVTGFGSHILVMNAGEQSVYEAEPLLRDTLLRNSLQNLAGIATVNAVAYKPVLFQSGKVERTIRTKNGKDSVFVQQEIMAGLLKGVDSSYDLHFFKENLISGRLPDFTTPEATNEILLSQQVAKTLGVKLNDDVKAFFVKNQPIRRNFKLVGIYETGLDEFDKKMALGDLRLVQNLNDWGVKAAITVEDTLYNGQLIVRAESSGGNGNYRYDWGKGFENYSGFPLCPTRDTVIRLIVSDYWSNIDGRNETTSKADTAFMFIDVQAHHGNVNHIDEDCGFQPNTDGTIDKTLTAEGFSIDGFHRTISFEPKDGPGSSSNYIGAYELTVNDWSALPTIYEKLKRQFSFIPTPSGHMLRVTSVTDEQADIFMWLGFLDLNVLIILTLMILIGIINMGSALLVLILVRTSFIGLLKSMGATDWSIRKIFLFQSGRLILRGMVLGNAVGLSLCGLQEYFGIIRLNPEVYYLDSVPIELNLTAWIALNTVTFVVCLAALIIPSIVITRIRPSKAIKFN